MGRPYCCQNAGRPFACFQLLGLLMVSDCSTRLCTLRLLLLRLLHGQPGVALPPCRCCLLAGCDWKCAAPHVAPTVGVCRERTPPCLPQTHLDILLQDLDGSRHQYILDLCCLLCRQGPALKLKHRLDAQRAGLVFLQQLLQPGGRLRCGCAGMQAAGRGAAVAAARCGGALLAPLLV